MEAIKALLKQIRSFWAGKDKRFKRNAIIIAAAVLAVVIVVSVLLNQVQYSTLYSGLSAEDSSAVIKALGDQKEPYKVSGDAILVPAKDADRLRMSLSTEVQSGFNLDILKQGQGLGLTESDKQDYRKAQLEYDLQRSIETVEGVKDARVLLTIPDESTLVITANQQDSTASLLLSLDAGVELSSSQVKAIAQFVQKSVPGLTLDNISIMDSNMESLDIGSTDGFSSANDQYALQNEVEAKLRKQVMALLLPIFGMGRVEAQVNVVLNFDDKVTDSTTYSPVVNDKDGVIVSYDKLKEQIVNGTDTSGEPGTDANTGTDTYPAVSGNNGTYEKTEDKVNLEVNSINEHLQQAKGSIENLSVSVVIDNTNMKTDLTDNVKSLVKNAVGAGVDSISVEYMPMQGSQSAAASMNEDSDLLAAGKKNEQTQFYIKLGAILLPLLVAMLLIFLYGKSRRRAEMDQQAAALAAQAASAEETRQTEEQLASINIVKDSGAKAQISKLIEMNPELVANLLRSWLADEQE